MQELCKTSSVVSCSEKRVELSAMKTPLVSALSDLFQTLELPRLNCNDAVQVKVCLTYERLVRGNTEQLLVDKEEVFILGYPN